MWLHCLLLTIGIQHHGRQHVHHILQRLLKSGHLVQLEQSQRKARLPLHAATNQRRPADPGIVPGLVVPGMVPGLVVETGTQDVPIRVPSAACLPACLPACRLACATNFEMNQLASCGAVAWPWAEIRLVRAV